MARGATLLLAATLLAATLMAAPSARAGKVKQVKEPPPVDTESVSCGRVNRGGLASPVGLEPRGPGYMVPEPWRSRGVRWGTEELIGLIRRAAAAVEEARPGALLGVGDLSRKRGGSVRNHRSHQAGRDVDLIYFALDEAGEPVPPGSCMPAYGPDGWASLCHYPVKVEVTPRRLDMARNWELIKALLTDGKTRVRVIFMSLGIRRALLDHAASMGEPRGLIRRAERTLMRPPRGRAHTDHMHLRIACTQDDRHRGRCRNDPDRRGRWYGRVRCPRRPAQPPAGEGK